MLTSLCVFFMSLQTTSCDASRRYSSDCSSRREVTAATPSATEPSTESDAYFYSHIGAEIGKQIGLMFAVGAVIALLSRYALEDVFRQNR